MNMKTLSKDIMKGVEAGGMLWAADRGLTMLDSVVAGAVGPALPANIRTPLVSIAGATILRQLLGKRIGDFAVAAAFKNAIGAFVDPTMRASLPMAYPTTTAGYAPSLGMGKARPGLSTGRGLGMVSRSHTRGYASQMA